MQLDGTGHDRMGHNTTGQDAMGPDSTGHKGIGTGQKKGHDGKGLLSMV